MDEALQQVDPLCRNIAVRIHAIMGPAATIATEIFKTADDGLVLEYENNKTEREVTFVVSAESKKTLFVAEGRSGTVVAEVALSDFASWLKGGKFPADGIVLPL